MTVLDHFSAPERRIPAALVAAFLLQTAGALFWAGSAAQRLAVLERDGDLNRAAIERVAVIGEQVSAMRASLDRIEAKLDTEQ